MGEGSFKKMFYIHFLRMIEVKIATILENPGVGVDYY